MPLPLPACCTSLLLLQICTMYDGNGFLLYEERRANAHQETRLSNDLHLKKVTQELWATIRRTIKNIVISCLWRWCREQSPSDKYLSYGKVYGFNFMDLFISSSTFVVGTSLWALWIRFLMFLIKRAKTYPIYYLCSISFVIFLYCSQIL